jgi:WD40 repeat protein
VATAGGAEPRGEVRLWDAGTGKELHRFTGDLGEERSVAFSPDGKQLLAVRSRGGDTVGTVWDVDSGQRILVLHRRGAGGLLFHPDGRLLEWSGVRLRDTATGQDVLTVRGLTPQGFTTAVFSRDGKRLATAEGPALPLAGVGGLSEAEVRLWDAATGQELKVFRGHPETVRCLALSPDATRLASGGEDRNVKVWDAATGREVLTYRGHALPVWHVMFTEDGKRVASVSMDGTLKLWDAATGKDVP